MVRLKGIEVTINTDDTALPEYRHPEDGRIKTTIAGPSVVRDVKATPNTLFAFKYNILARRYKWSTDIHIKFFADGKAPKGNVLSMQHSKQRYTAVADGIKNPSKTGWTHQRFQFGMLDTIEDNLGQSVKEPEARLGSVGTLVVEVCRYKTTATVQRRNAHDFCSTSEVPEKAVKGSAADLAIELASPTDIGPSKSVDGYDLGQQPLATFVFVYRTHGALQALRIIDRPIPLSERDITTLKKTELQERIRQLEAEQENNKQEPGQDE